jgi:amidohydrolase
VAILAQVKKMNIIIELRQRLHQIPELAHKELETSKTLLNFFKNLSPDQSITNLGGNGLAFVFSGKKPGPTFLLRAELDAVPVNQENNIAHRSTKDKIAHICGHDGHMAILAAVGQQLSEQRPDSGKVVLLFQPAEEDGQGAAAVINDEKFAQIKPDFAFALHNLPGYATGDILIKSGPFASASIGMSIKLTGVSAHAAQPETGISPANAMIRIIKSLSYPPAHILKHSSHPIITVVGANLGAKAFGTAPGEAEIWVTLRAETDKFVETLLEYAQETAEKVAEHENLKLAVSTEDVFPATINADSTTNMLRHAAENYKTEEIKQAFYWSEDFGHFGKTCYATLFGLGAGENCAHLHNPDYDFPDELISIGVEIYGNLIKQNLG